MAQRLFEKVVIRRVDLDKPENTYYVFKNSVESVEVQASSAVEAIEKSGVQDPLCVKNIKYKFYESSVINDRLKSVITENNSDMPQSNSQ